MNAPEQLVFISVCRETYSLKHSLIVIIITPTPTLRCISRANYWHAGTVVEQFDPVEKSGQPYWSPVIEKMKLSVAAVTRGP